MKASYLIVAFLLSLSIALQSQTVDSIKVEQAGDFIKIRYKILNSTPEQVYRVKVLCSMDGGLNTEIRSISGDVGDMVAGGKPEYWILWDVLKDVEELKSVEFIVRAELVKDLSAFNGKEIDWTKKRFHLMLAANLPGPQSGLRISYMGNWGFSAAILYGKAGLQSGYIKGADPSDPHPKVPYIGLGLTKRLVKKDNFQMHLMVGSSISKFFIQDFTASTFYTETCIGYNLGFTFDIKRFSFSLGTSFFSKDKAENQSHTDDLGIHSSSGYFDAGFGIKF
ncbi:MAG: hypothetical protein MUE91_13525 [Ignavibacteriaceae bacterium]|jgi:hypothetical protein|nr:hypothetical protein [Ignavibacteriaceae bacterium]